MEAMNKAKAEQLFNENSLYLGQDCILLDTARELLGIRPVDKVAARDQAGIKVQWGGDVVALTWGGFLEAVTLHNVEYIFYMEQGRKPLQCLKGGKERA